MTVAKQILKYKLYFVGVQEVRWDGGGTEQEGEYTFGYGKGYENHELGAGSFVYKRIMSAVKTVEFVSDRVSYIILSGRWCDVIVLNVRASREDKINGTKGSFCEKLERVFDKFSKYHTKILLGDFNAKKGRKAHFQTNNWEREFARN
jgi:hypothetical protein